MMDGRDDPRWGQPYGDAAYMTDSGPVWLHRKGQRCRFFDPSGEQVGPEQSNVFPAITYAAYMGWRDTDAPEWLNTLAHTQTRSRTTLRT